MREYHVLLPFKTGTVMFHMEMDRDLLGPGIQSPLVAGEGYATVVLPGRVSAIFAPRKVFGAVDWEMVADGMKAVLHLPREDHVRRETRVSGLPCTQSRFE